MKCIIAGSRDVWSLDLLDQVIEESGFDITHVVEGGAYGMDAVGAAWSIINNIPFTTIHADWNRHGKSAGYKRNVEMANTEGVSGLIAIRKSGSKGTTHMINIARDKGLQVFYKDI